MIISSFDYLVISAFVRNPERFASDQSSATASFLDSPIAGFLKVINNKVINDVLLNNRTARGGHGTGLTNPGCRPTVSCQIGA